ncbi:aldehyde dehydrogenase family protein [Streptomyces sp. 184]|uniref:aldehyde dehydrogenase family protein n=1 Tax=Streptomyces sp. 184 TaxID=1827526 RepID=UPI0038914394
MSDILSSVPALPRGAVNVVVESGSEVARLLVESPRVPLISFTGRSRPSRRPDTPMSESTHMKIISVDSAHVPPVSAVRAAAMKGRVPPAIAAANSRLTATPVYRTRVSNCSGSMAAWAPSIRSLAKVSMRVIAIHTTQEWPVSSSQKKGNERSAHSTAPGGGQRRSQPGGPAPHDEDVGGLTHRKLTGVRVTGHGGKTSVTGGEGGGPLLSAAHGPDGARHHACFRARFTRALHTCAR